MNDPPIELDPIEQTQAWHITAVGNRTRDYIQRDVLFASLIRDPRGARFQRLSREPEDWMVELVKHLEGPSRKQALDLVALQYLHYEHLSRTPAPEDLGDDDGHILEAIRDARKCTPCGARLQRAKGKAKLSTCKRHRICPWCHARMVTRLYDDLNKFPRHSSETSFLHQALCSFDSLDLNMTKVDIWYDHVWLFGGGDPVDQHENPFTLQVLYVKEVVRQQLRQAAAELGICDGLTTYQVTPGKDPEGNRTYRHQLGLLGVRSGDTDQRHAAAPKVSFLRATYGHDLNVSWLNMRALHQSSLRIMLAGSSATYPARDRVRDQMLTGNTKPILEGTDGVAGVLDLSPTYLWDNYRLFEYFRATKNLQVVTFFGDWRRNGASSKKKPEQPGEWDRKERHVKAYKNRRLKKANTKRAQSASDRRSQYLDSALAIWEKVQQRASQRAQQQGGRPPVREMLIEMLSELGHDISDRDAKWLMKQLRVTN